MWRSLFLCKKMRSEGRKMKNLLILGAGGHGHVVAETARAMTDSEGKPLYDKISFLDDLKPEANAIIKKRISGSISGSWKL